MIKLLQIKTIENQRDYLENQGKLKIIINKTTKKNLP